MDSPRISQHMPIQVVVPRLFPGLVDSSPILDVGLYLRDTEASQ